MNVNRMRAYAAKNRMEMQASMGNQPNHQQHIRDYCDYADATAQAAAEEAIEDLKPMIGKEITRQIQQGKASVEVDKASVKAAKKAIDDLHAYIKKVFK